MMNWQRIAYCQGYTDGYLNAPKRCTWTGKRMPDYFEGYKAGAHERERVDRFRRIISDFGLNAHIEKMRAAMKTPKIEVRVGRQPELLLRDAPPGYYELFVGIGDVQWVPVIVSRHTPPGCQSQTVAINLENPAVTYLGNVRGNNPVRIPESPLELKVTF